MNNRITAVAKSLINLIYPLHCAACGKALEASGVLSVCQGCFDKIRRRKAPCCPGCGRSVYSADTLCAECRKMKPRFSRSRSACLYEDVLKKLILDFKYKKRTSIEKVLSRLMIDFLNDEPELIRNADAVTYVPLHARRLRQRGFNQSKALASGISRAFSVPLLDLLEKTARTKNQNELSRQERLANLKGAFRIRKGAGRFKDLRILIVDDVMTTGATLDECSGVLVDGGAKEVSCLTLARGA